MLKLFIGQALWEWTRFKIKPEYSWLRGHHSLLVDREARGRDFGWGGQASTAGFMPGRAVSRVNKAETPYLGRCLSGSCYSLAMQSLLHAGDSADPCLCHGGTMKCVSTLSSCTVVQSALQSHRPALWKSWFHHHWISTPPSKPLQPVWYYAFPKLVRVLNEIFTHQTIAPVTGLWVNQVNRNDPKCIRSACWDLGNAAPWKRERARCLIAPLIPVGEKDNS